MQRRNNILGREEENMEKKEFLSYPWESWQPLLRPLLL